MEPHMILQMKIGIYCSPTAGLVFDQAQITMKNVSEWLALEDIDGAALVLYNITRISQRDINWDLANSYSKVQLFIHQVYHEKLGISIPLYQLTIKFIYSSDFW